MKRARIIRTVISILLAAVFVYSAVQLGLVLHGYEEAKQEYNGIQDEFVVSTEPAESQATASGDTVTSKEIAPISVDFDKLIKKNEDVVGWIYCEDTVINYPVVQSNSNTEYLKKGLNGKKLSGGTIFADCRNNSVGYDRNYMLYGHNMRNGTMFGTLTKYKKQSYYDKHPTMYLLTPEGDYKIELVAGKVVSTTEMIYKISPDETAFDSYLEKLCKKSTFKSNVTLETGDKIITLSTCSYETENSRYVVIGKLIPLG